MNVIKNCIRYLLAKLSIQIGMPKRLRSFYLSRAHNYVLNLDPNAVTAAWVRRSVTNEDFVPFLSDVDLTLVIDEKHIQKAHLPSDLLVKDIQIIPQEFFNTWIQSGGFRNYLQGEWIPLRGTVELPKTSIIKDESLLAFDLSHEIYLLYHQLEKNLHAFPDPFVKNARKKILLDIIKVQTYWSQREEEVLRKPRTSFASPTDIDQFMVKFSRFCDDLMKHLIAPINSFNCFDLVSKEFEDSFEVYFHVLGKPVMVVKNPKNFSKILKQYPDHFVAPESFLNLVKGVGVHEQTLLNQLAKDTTSHYFKFNQQRLALDLIGAVVLFPENQRQLFFCFKNIQDFVNCVNEKRMAPEWTKIHQLWEDKGIVATTKTDLYRLNEAYLEVLRTIG